MSTDIGRNPNGQSQARSRLPSLQQPIIVSKPSLTSLPSPLLQRPLPHHGVTPLPAERAGGVCHLCASWGQEVGQPWGWGRIQECAQIP